MCKLRLVNYIRSLMHFVIHKLNLKSNAQSCKSRSNMVFVFFLSYIINAIMSDEKAQPFIYEKEPELNRIWKKSERTWQSKLLGNSLFVIFSSKRSTIRCELSARVTSSLDATPGILTVLQDKNLVKSKQFSIEKASFLPHKVSFPIFPIETSNKCW